MNLNIVDGLLFGLGFFIARGIMNVLGALILLEIRNVTPDNETDYKQ